MILRPVTLSLLFILALSRVLSGAQDAPPQVAGPANAALVYWVAFDQYRTLERDEQITKALSDYSIAEIDAKLRKALQESPALALLQQASRLDHCDWGVGHMIREQGLSALIPHMWYSRRLSWLGLLRARIHLLDNEPAHALDGLMMLFRLARHVQSDGLYLSMLVGIAIDSAAHRFVADYIELFDAKTLRRFLEEYAKLPAMMHPKAAVLGERDHYGSWLKRTVSKPGYKDAIARSMATLVDDEKNDARLYLLLRQSQAQMIAMADGLLEHYTEFANGMELPPDKFDGDEAIKKITESRNYMVMLMMPQLTGLHRTYHLHHAQRAMVRAAITFKLDGGAAFEKIKDPYGDEPFTFKALDEGTELSSKLLDLQGKPISMIFKWKPAEK